MLGFLISTIGFSATAYALNRYFDAQTLGNTQSRKVLVMVVATIISIGIGWLVDRLDGDAALPRKNVSIADVIQSGDPLLIAKMLAGVN